MGCGVDGVTLEVDMGIADANGGEGDGTVSSAGADGGGEGMKNGERFFGISECPVNNCLVDGG